MSDVSNVPTGVTEIEQRLAAVEALAVTLEKRSVEQQQIIDSQQKIIEELKELLKPSTSSILRDDLKPKEREVLQGILDLPEDAFSEAEQLIASIIGSPMTEAFAKSFAAVMTQKKWAVACGKCEKPSAIYWSAGQRYAEGGRGQFSHAGKNGSDKHGSLSVIPELQFLKKIDRRRSIKE